MTISDAKASKAKELLQAGKGQHQVRKKLKIGKSVVSSIAKGTWNAAKRAKLQKNAAVVAKKKSNVNRLVAGMGCDA